MLNNNPPYVAELTVNVKEFPDYVTDCPCSFTKEYMMKKIRRERYHQLKELISFESDRPSTQDIEYMDTDKTIITLHDVDLLIYPERC